MKLMCATLRNVDIQIARHLHTGSNVAEMVIQVTDLITGAWDIRCVSDIMDDTTMQNTVPNEKPLEVQSFEVPNENRKKLLMAGIAGIVIIIIVLVSFYAINKGSGPSPKTSSTTTILSNTTSTILQNYSHKVPLSNILLPTFNFINDKNVNVTYRLATAPPAQYGLLHYSRYGNNGRIDYGNNSYSTELFKVNNTYLACSILNGSASCGTALQGQNNNTASLYNDYLTYIGLLDLNIYAPYTRNGMVLGNVYINYLGNLSAYNVTYSYTQFNSTYPCASTYALIKPNNYINGTLYLCVASTGVPITYNLYMHYNLENGSPLLPQNASKLSNSTSFISLQIVNLSYNSSSNYVTPNYIYNLTKR